MSSAPNQKQMRMGKQIKSYFKSGSLQIVPSKKACKNNQ
jgi:hypothetical protein